MPIVITEQASAAQSIATIGPVTGEIAWESPQQALSDNGVNASMQFNGTSSTSEFLYLSDFGFSIPTETVVNGIKAKVVRSGVGITEDYYVGLVYTDSTLDITSPGKQKSTDWTADGTVEYGSDSDSWNKVWTPSEINDSSFGIAISAEGDPVALDAALLDFIEIELTYHYQFDELPIGGTSAGGVATVQFVSNSPEETGGVIGSGHGGLIFPLITASGGTTIGGAAPFTSGYMGIGGASSSGVTKFGLTIDTPTWVVDLDTNQLYNPKNKTTSTATADLFLRDGTLSWRITHAELEGGVNNIVIQGPAPPGQSAATKINVANFSTDITVSPVTGSRDLSSITNSEQELEDDMWYIKIGSVSYPGGELKGQITKQSVSIGGSAELTLSDIIEVTGGVSLGGTAPAFNFLNPTGGAIISDDMQDFSYTANVEFIGGADVGGSANIDPFVMDGGIKVNGESEVDIIYSADISGGLEIGGTNINRQVIPIGGGISVGGNTLHVKQQFAVIESSGVSASGESIVKPHFIFVTGGLSIGGHAFVDPCVTNGGISVGGTSTQTQYHDTNLQPNEFEFIARGKHAVPQNPTIHTATCNLFMRVVGTNPLTSIKRLHWHIDHDFGTSLDAVRLRGPTSTGSTAGTQISIDFIQSVNVNPITGSALVSNSQKDDILDGKWYLYMRDDQGSHIIRGQIVGATGATTGGIVPQLFFSQISGGPNVGGAAEVQYIANTQPTGGVEFTGVTFSQIIVGTGGGISTGGSGYLSTSFSPLIANGGILANGVASEDSVFNTAVTGGTMAGSQGVIGIGPSVGSGTAICGSASGFQWIYIPAIEDGGVLLSPFHKQQFTDFYISVVKVRVGGKTIGDKIKQIVKQRHRNVGISLKSENIFDVKRVPALIPPTNDVSPPLNDGRFRIEHQPDWCDIPDKCEQGALAEVIVRRQKGHVPTKSRDSAVRDRRIASAI